MQQQQQVTERTSLTRPVEQHGYVEFAGIIRSRRSRIRQFQCCVCATLIATFIMALIITISYTVSHPDIEPPEANVSLLSNETQETSSGNLLKSSGRSSTRVTQTLPSSLSDDEVRVAVAAGDKAIAARRLADSVTRPLPSPSPNSRHQYAVSTSSRADGLALAGVAEIAATRRIESARSFMGKPTSFGSFIDGGWTPDGVNACTGRMSLSCLPGYAARYRRFDGTCNHPRQLGMAFTPYRRALPPDYADGIDAPRIGIYGNNLPSAREVSLKVHPPSPSTNPSFTVMLAVFGQFLDHDITATAISRGTNGSSLSCCPPNGGHPECFPVKVGPGDPVYDVAGSSCMEFVRSAPAAQCKIGPRQQMNQVTAFIDGSAIYGSDTNTADGLREFSGGRLRMQSTPDKRLLLPASANPHDGCNRQLELARGRYCFATGDARANENLHLTTMHLLWARQHNRLADELGNLNPQWDDERLYQESRRIVGAQLQHLTYREFVPIVLGETETAKRNLRPLGAGYRPRNGSDVDPTIANHFAAAAFRFAHTLLPGLMKVTDKEKGTSSYVQLHKMLFNPYSLYSEGGVESSITAATSNAIQKTSTHVTSQLTEHLFEDPLGNQTTVPCGLDLVSLNIQRGRDHGLPGYTKWREYCGRRKPLKFDDLKDDMDTEALDAISKLYDNVDDVDLYTGALAEPPKGDGILGPTFTCLIADQFERLQSGDKYWYETADQPGSFSEDQLQELRKTSLARIICDTSDGIDQVQAQVMRSVGPDNPIISCEDIPKLSLNAWKTEMPLLTLTETEVPVEDWLNFKSEVNKTISDIVSTIMARKPPAGSLPADWLAFQKDINMTFADLRNKFSTLHPKAITNASLYTRNLTAESEAFDWVGIKDEVNKTVSEIIDSISANKPPPGSLPTDWLIYKKKINDSLTDIRNKFKAIHPKVTTQKSVSGNLKEVGDIPMIDWAEVKNNINSTITDIVNSINASKPLPGSDPADWIAFRKKINDSLVVIKNKFKALHPKPIPVEKANEAVDGATFDWIEFKDQLNKTLNNIIASTIAKKPPAGSTSADWLAFQKEMNATFAQFVNQFSDLHPKPVDNNKLKTKLDESTIASTESEIDAVNSVNKTVTDIAAEIKAMRPPPGSTQEDWLKFRQKMSSTFANMKNKYTYLYPKNANKPTAKLSQSEANSTFDVVAFRKDLNKSLSNLVSLIKTNKPALDSPKADWLAYKKEVKAAVSEVKNKFALFKTKELLAPDYIEYTAESDPAFDWAGYKSQINKTIDGLLDDMKTIPAGDPKWASFRDNLNKTFTDLKNKVAAMRIKASSQAKLMAIMNEDWLNFKDRINSTIEDAFDDINSNKPAPGDPAWENYNLYIKNRFAQMREDIKAIKTEWFEKVKVGTEMMTVTKTQLSATSSASALKLLGIKYHLNISIVFIATAFLII